MRPSLTPADRIARAEESLAAGFTSEAARKHTLTYDVAVAFDNAVGGAIRDKLLAPGVDREATKHLYWGVPAIANWKPKHDAMFVDFPDEVAFANVCVALRNKIKAAALVAKAPTKTSIAEAARAAVAKTCQICGRPILAETGLIAHHGYTRPGDGMQTASCYGARYLSFEVSNGRLGQYIEALKNGLANMKKGRKAAADETTYIGLEYVVSELPEGETRAWKSVDRTVWFSITRATFDAAKAEHPKFFQFNSTNTFDAFKARDLAQRDAKIKDQIEYIKMQQGRFDAWTAVA